MPLRVRCSERYVGDLYPAPEGPTHGNRHLPPAARPCVMAVPGLEPAMSSCTVPRGMAGSIPGLHPTGAKIAVIATIVPQLSWPGLARPPTSCGASRIKVVGDRPSPAMTRGVVLPTSRHFSANGVKPGDGHDDVRWAMRTFAGHEDVRGPWRCWLGHDDVGRRMRILALSVCRPEDARFAVPAPFAPACEVNPIRPNAATS